MTHRQDRIRGIFLEAVELPLDRRAAFLDDACQGDAELRSEVERLIAADNETATLVFRPPPSAAPRLEEGQLLAGRFRVVRFIASGGMGDVYEADDLELHERLALKTIRPEVVGDGRALARFKHEVQFAKRVSHPNVCRIHDIGTHRGPVADMVFLTMQLLPGETLSQRLRRDGRMPAPEALPLVVQMAEALGAAHDAGVIHRDFKPSNVMLTGARAMVTDFGLAQWASAAEDASLAELTELTDTGNLVGTPAYMAPEQLTHGEVTAATDIYALGLVMYEMLTGKKPFQGVTPLDSALKRLTEAPPSPDRVVPGLDTRWATVILRCLERDPVKRYQRTGDVIRALTPGAESDTRTMTGFVPGFVSKLVKRPLPWIATGIVLAVVAAIGGVWFLGRHRPPAEAVRWYDEGTRALRDGTSYTAMKAFERAVQLDGDFTLAHARLAEAATELDYMDKAQSEMLRASPPAYQSLFLLPVEKLRLEAVYFALVKDFARSAAAYKDLAAKVGQSERPAVLVDLGRAYESAGKIPEALASYTESAKSDGQFAAAFLRRGILEGKQQQSAKAGADFDVAEQLYHTEGKAEGLTEVLIQRSSLLRATGKLAEARGPTEKALEMARVTRDEYHQITALLALSQLSYSSGDADGGRQQAQQAIDLSRRAGIEVLAASGLVEVGTALYHKGEYAAAEPYVRDAIEAARRFQAVQVEARAELTLGLVLVKEEQIDEAVGVLKQAIGDYQRAGDKSGAARVAIPIARTLREQGDYEAAGNLFREQLEHAEQVKDDGGIALAAQGLGSVLVRQEQYPAALASFDRSAAVSRALADQSVEGYSLGNRADVLWRLGRYQEAGESLNAAETLVQRLGGNKPLLASVYGSRAEMDLSRERFNEAEEDIRRMLGAAGNSPAFETFAKSRLGLVRVRAGRAREGIALCEESVEKTRETKNVRLLKNAELDLAEAKLQAGDASGALTLAAGLAQYFAIKGQNESEFRARMLAAAASRGADRSGHAEGAKAALAKLRQGLGAEAFTVFSSRPDIRAILQRTGLISGVR
jgi:eukaryotic-like serine/threonine-protein kinase